MTINFEQSVQINRPIQEVYEFVSDVSNDTLWMPWLDSCELAEGPKPSSVAEGQRRRIKQTDFGVQTETLMEATEVEPGRFYRFESVDAPIDLSASYRYESVERGTKLTRIYEAEMTGLINRLLEPLMARRMKRRWAADFDRIKELLETTDDG